MCFYFLLATGGFAVVENDRLVQMAVEIEAITGRDRSASYLIRNATLLGHNLILPHQSVVKQRDTAEERAAKAKGGATAKSSKRKPFSKHPIAGGKKLKKSDGPSPSTCPDVPEEEDVEEERGEDEGGEAESGSGGEGDGDGHSDDGGDGQSGGGTGALSSKQAGVIQEWTDDDLRLAFEGSEEGSVLVERPKKADKAEIGADSSKSASAKAIPAIQGEFSVDSIYDKDLEVFYGLLPSWNQI